MSSGYHRHLPVKSNSKFDRAEYDFSSIPKNELWPCLFFELSREMPSVNSMVKTWRKHEPLLSNFPFSEHSLTRTRFIKKLKLPREDTRDIFMLTYRGYRVTLASPEFPALPWQNLPPAHRQSALKTLNLTTNTFIRPKELSLPQSKATTMAFPIMNWGKSDTQLVEELKDWLKHCRPAASEEPKPGPSIGAKEFLTRMGAYRICRRAKETFGSVDKFDLVDSSWIDKDPRTLRQYRKDIQKLIDHQEDAWAGVVKCWI